MSGQLSFGTMDVAATLTPEKPWPGSKPATVRVYARFGRVKERTVQEICDAVGGDAVYFEFKTPDGKYLMPVVAWKRPAFAGNGDSCGLLTRAADALKLAADNSWTIVVYGSARRRWLVDFHMIRASAARDALDMEPDSNGAPRSVGPLDAPNGMREEF
jgi:hypothetical protein